MPHTVLAQASFTWICFFLLLHIRVIEKENGARITKRSEYAQPCTHMLFQPTR